MSMEQLAQMGVDESAYVWHSGLPDWVRITNVPELKEMLENNNGPAQDEPVPNLPEQEAGSDELVTSEVVDEDEIPSLDNVMESNEQSPYMAGNYGPAMAAAQPMPAPEEVPECPPTNLVWSSIVTLLCCTPAGIVGIVFAFLTKKHYRQGNYKKAQRMSDYGAWAVIASIILGIISMPLSCAMQAAKMAIQ